MQVLKGYRLGMWSKSHNLSKMSLRELVVAYFQYYAIQAYLLLTVAAVWVAAVYPTTLAKGALAAGFAVAAYPLAWYLLHRYVLHGQWMFKSQVTARVWKRIHYDHHQDPNHLEILFGALYTTLPTIALLTIPVGYAIGGVGAAAVAFAGGLLMTCFYEFCHCIQHLPYKPKSKWLAEMKARHMAHHFHDESGNFGITTFAWDRLFGTFYDREERPAKSATVFNLGYTGEVARIYPWVAKMSGGVAEGHPRERLKKAA
jgi:sterol desaturase/sphingolipid hydroxylase (fatty acid hydroxylase superfamily)